MSALKALRLALVQNNVFANKGDTLKRVKELVHKAAANGANLICLPECFNCPLGAQYFPKYCEKVPGECSNVLSELAKDLSIHLIGGSLPEEEDGKIFNTSLVYGPDGSLLAKHRKVHLFDVDVPGGIKFTESEVISPGNQLTMFSIGECKIGLGICYDIRFSEMSLQYEKQGCQLIVYPAAFNMTTGPKHWELLLRARSNDHQAYVAACSTARDENASYVSWAHSTICNPWGEVVAKAGVSEEIIYTNIDLGLVEAVRTALPIQKQKRMDIYG